MASKLKQFERKDFENVFIVKNYPKSLISEATRVLRTNIKFSSLEKRIRTLLITSPVREVGKSSVCINLSLTIAQNKEKVVLIDADLRKPTLHKILGQESEIGLTDILTGHKETKDVIRNLTRADPNFYFIPSGPIPPNPSELLGSNRMKELLEELQEQADFVIFDSPPTTVVADCVSVSYPSRWCGSGIRFRRSNS